MREKEIKINKFSRKSKSWKPLKNLESLPKDIKEKSFLAGIDLKEETRSGTYFQINHSVIYERVQKMFKNKIEVMSTREALEKYDWLKDYFWKTISKDKDEFTKQADKNFDNGYFLRILPNAKIEIPIQSCLFISQENLNQNVHNIIIAEENSKAHIITGCTTSVERSLHVGISEFYIKKNAFLTFTMIHNWEKQTYVRPRTAAIIYDNGVFYCNYINIRPVKSLQMYPVAYCKGENSSARFYTLLYGKEKAFMDVGSKIVLQGKNSSGEVTSRVVAEDESYIIARGLLVGENPESKAHLECRGLLLSKKAKIRAIPELLGLSEGSELSHEAAVGKIKPEELYYLMSRGLSEEQAISLIVRGFLDVDIPGLPKKLKEDIKNAVEKTRKTM